MVVEICVEAAVGAPDCLGSCPQCHRILLILEEKEIPYKLHLINLYDKPEWFLKITPRAALPVVKFDGKWETDLFRIDSILEKRYPQPSLVTPRILASKSERIFLKVEEFAKSKNPYDGTKQILVKELKALEEHLRAHGPFIAGGKITDADLTSAAYLYQLVIVLGHFKNWTIPESFSCVHNYIQLLFSRESFNKTKSTKEHMIARWDPYLRSVGAKIETKTTRKRKQVISKRA